MSPFEGRPDDLHRDVGHEGVSGPLGETMVLSELLGDVDEHG